MLDKKTVNLTLDSKSISTEEYPPLVTPEEETVINDFYKLNNIEKNAWIQTYTGKKVFPLDPREEDIDIEDIAHSLSLLCRFNGHASRFYSVAEHCVLVSYFSDPKYGLLHDGSECYICDLSSPLKQTPTFEKYRSAENKLQTLIYKKFGLNDPEPASVKKADLQMLATEAYCLMVPLHPEWKVKYEPFPILICGLPPVEAENLFLNRFKEVFSG
jgi:hypothetical protein